MKKLFLNLNKILAIVLLFGFVLSSCEIDKSINVDPNAIAEAKVKSVDGIYGLLVALQVNAADSYTRDRSRIHSIWSWQMCAPPGIARPQPVAWNEYVMTTDGPVDDYWVITFRGVKIANDIINFTPEVFTGDNEALGKTIIGIAQTYKALLLGEVAATYGSIPITQEGTNAPAFVTQAEAYAEVQKILDAAIANFATAKAITRDLNFGGNGAKWIAAANSLKARFYLHIGKYTEALAATNAGIVAADGNLYGKFANAAGEYANWGMWVQNESEPIRGEKLFVDLLKSEAGDTRLADYFAPNADGEFYGFAAHSAGKYPTAVVDGKETNFDLCVRMVKYSQYDEAFPLISYEETVLIKAECAALANDLTTALTNVNIIRTAAGLTDFTSSDKDVVIAEVLKQKNLELYLEGQVYHDMRRTGTLPEAIFVNETMTNIRWIYGESEKNANKIMPVDNNKLCEETNSTKYGGKR